MKKVVAVVVTYNRKELLRECICNLNNQDYKDCIVLVIDNNSNDNTKEYIYDLIKDNKCIYRNTGENLGGAGGFNYGIKEAMKIGADYIWLMDDDCMVKRNSLTSLLEFDRNNKEYGFLSSRVLWKDNSICTMNIQRETLTKNLQNIDEGNYEITMASFVSLFLKADIIREVGLPIKEFFIWTDDWEYTRRISRKYKCYFVGKSTVVHKCVNNMGASIEKTSLDRLDRFRYLYRNDVFLYRKEGLKGYTYMILRLMYHTCKISLSKDKFKFKKIKLMLSSTINGFRFKPEIEYIRTEGEK